ncbi:MAG: adenylate/guanylate cyclase domain-containing protein [Alkalinema sp. CACIAM 70d]|nr:MAG: adenylate/guanylate cyclase domain-containing protein [Alkalinema sp. CACIAM 70d]
MTLQARWQWCKTRLARYWETCLNSRQITPAVVAVLLGCGLWQVGAWQSLERLGYNLLFQIREQLPHPGWDDRIVVVAIDDATLEHYRQFPLPRHLYTELLQTLEASQPAAVGFDLLFAEPTPEDAKFAQALEINGKAVIAIAANRHRQVINLVPQLTQVTGQGHIHSRPDPDGVYRQIDLYIRGFPALSVAMLQAYNQSLSQIIQAPDQPPLAQPAVLPPANPTQPEQTAWINWPGLTQGPKGVPTYSLVKILKGKVDPSAFANKIVLVGVTATGNDPLQTSLEQHLPTSGVYMHAAVIDNLLNQRLLQRSPDWVHLLILVSIGIISNLVLFPLGFRQRTVVALILPCAWIAIAVAALMGFNLWLPTFAPIGTFLIAGTSLQLLEQREKQLVMRLFARHVAPETAKLIWNHRSEIFQQGQLTAQEMVVTVLFTDIRSFTSISEAMSPCDLLDWLNQYLDAMTDCIHAHHGVVDKYIGDAIMAVFGIPFPSMDAEMIQQDALNAVSAAIAMQERLALLNHQLQAAGQPTIRAGIGIHTGLVVAGSIGGAKRVNYSILGDAVNVAARLEALNKQLHQQNCYDILISEDTFIQVGHQVQGYPVETLKLRGRQQKTGVYAIQKADQWIASENASTQPAA